MRCSENIKDIRMPMLNLLNDGFLKDVATRRPSDSPFPPSLVSLPLINQIGQIIPKKGGVSLYINSIKPAQVMFQSSQPGIGVVVVLDMQVELHKGWPVVEKSLRVKQTLNSKTSPWFQNLGSCQNIGCRCRNRGFPCSKDLLGHAHHCCSHAPNLTASGSMPRAHREIQLRQNQRLKKL